MTLYRWDLRRLAWCALVVAAIAMVAAEILDRANELAHNHAEGAVEWHEMQHHEDVEDE